MDVSASFASLGPPQLEPPTTTETHEEAEDQDEDQHLLSTRLIKLGLSILSSCIKLKIGLTAGPSENHDGLLAAGSSREGLMAADTLVFWNAIRRFAGVGEVEEVAEEEGDVEEEGGGLTSSSSSTLPSWHLEGIVSLLSLLSRGGRTVYPLTGAADLLCDWAGVLFRRQEAERRKVLARERGGEEVVGEGPLKDPRRETPFIRLMTTATSTEDHNPALSLLIAFHKFSCPQLSGPLVDRCTGSVVSLAASTTSEEDVEKVLNFVETIVTFGYVPRAWLREVVELVARVVGCEGREVVAEISSTTEEPTKAGGGVGGGGNKLQDPPPAFANRGLVPLRPELLSHAKLLMRNLIRSPANQAIRCLRGILSHSADHISANSPGGFFDRHQDPISTATTANGGDGEGSLMGPSSTMCELPLIVGALRCLRYALEDVDEDIATSSANAINAGGETHDSDVQRAASATLLSMGLPVLLPQLEVVMSCNVPELDYEVLALADARLAAGQAKVVAATARWTEGHGDTAGEAEAEEDRMNDELAAEHGEMWDIWDATLDLMQVAADRLEVWEGHILSGSDRRNVVAAWVLGADDGGECP